ncbi:hypothetical protein [uncultured Paludibaculum sp.]|uniref:hypothetical protein n=1 Tax=uncultured Paludibaculum sp. TaxID=1765020 RepID=UPI002AAA9E35|nr:hypothetical protein [uncultured Paludibaculum sp.]
MLLHPALLLSLLLAPAPDSGLALQAVVQTNFEYLSSSRTTNAEFWIVSLDRTYEKRGNQVRRVVQFAPPAETKADFHTLGFDYEPNFRLVKIEDTTSTRTVLGRTCRLTTAWATADYAEAHLRFWLCPQSDEREAKLNAAVARAVSGRFSNLEQETVKLLESRHGQIVLEASSDIEPPIAPLMKLTARVLSLDAKAIEGNLTLPPEGDRDAR